MKFTLAFLASLAIAAHAQPGGGPPGFRRNGKKKSSKIAPAAQFAFDSDQQVLEVNEPHIADLDETEYPAVRRRAFEYDIDEEDNDIPNGPPPEPGTSGKGHGDDEEESRSIAFLAGQMGWWGDSGRSQMDGAVIIEQNGVYEIDAKVMVGQVCGEELGISCEEFLFGLEPNPECATIEVWLERKGYPIRNSLVSTTICDPRWGLYNALPGVCCMNADADDPANCIQGGRCNCPGPFASQTACHAGAAGIGAIASQWNGITQVCTYKFADPAVPTCPATCNANGGTATVNSYVGAFVGGLDAGNDLVNEFTCLIDVESQPMTTQQLNLFTTMRLNKNDDITIVFQSTHQNLGLIGFDGNGDRPDQASASLRITQEIKISNGGNGGHSHDDE